jgi:hypothetical protein
MRSVDVANSNQESVSLSARTWNMVELFQDLFGIDKQARKQDERIWASVVQSINTRGGCDPLRVQTAVICNVVAAAAADDGIGLGLGPA